MNLENKENIDFISTGPLEYKKNFIFYIRVTKPIFCKKKEYWVCNVYSDGDKYNLNKEIFSNSQFQCIMISFNYIREEIIANDISYLDKGTNYRYETPHSISYSYGDDFYDELLMKLDALVQDKQDKIKKAREAHERRNGLQ